MSGTQEYNVIGENCDLQFEAANQLNIKEEVVDNDDFHVINRKFLIFYLQASTTLGINTMIFIC